MSALTGKDISLREERFSPKIVTKDNIKQIYPIKKLKTRPRLGPSEEELVSAALYSGHASIVDYFRSYFNMEMVTNSSPYKPEYGREAFLSPRNKVQPIEFLSIVQRTAYHGYIEEAIKQGNTDVLVCFASRNFM
nr:hypothetical protein Cbor_83 [Cedratvirus borely]